MNVTLCGEKFEVDFLDYDRLTEMEHEMEEVQNKTMEMQETALNGGMRQSELILQAVGIISDFFDGVLGEGASDRIFKGRVNYGLALRAFGDFVIQKNRSGDDIRSINREYEEKIRRAQEPVGNREQRRAGNKNRKNRNRNGQRYPNNNGPFDMQ